MVPHVVGKISQFCSLGGAVTSAFLGLIPIAHALKSIPTYFHQNQWNWLILPTTCGTTLKKSKIKRFPTYVRTGKQISSIIRVCLNNITWLVLQDLVEGICCIGCVARTYLDVWVHVRERGHHRHSLHLYHPQQSARTLYLHLPLLHGQKGQDKAMNSFKCDILHGNIDQTLVNSLHGLLNCEIGGLDCRIIITEYKTHVH